MPLENYSQFGGKHPETAGLCNILAYYDVTAPHTGKPFSEALLLGIGGGIGAGYFVFQYGQESTFFVGTRGFWHEVGGEFSERIIKRLGGKAEVRKTRSQKSALANLLEPLEEEKPVSVAVDLGVLPYWALKVQYIFHTVVVCGYDSGSETFEIDDMAPEPWKVTQKELAQARASIQSQENRTLTVIPPKKEPDLRKAVVAGIQDCMKDMHNPRMKNFGLTALEKWGELILDRKDAKGWPRAFPPGPNLYRALFFTYHWIETSGTGGGAFRRLYADFLEEAAEILAKRELAALSKQYRELSSLWSELADTALPDNVEALSQAKKLIRKKFEWIMKKGPSARKQIERTSRELERLEQQAQKDFPLEEGEISSLLEKMKQKIVRIHAAEEDTLRRLQEAIG